MAEDLKKQLEVIREHQLKIDEIEEAIVKDFIEESKEVDSITAYADEVEKLEELVDKTKEAYYYAVTGPLKATLLNVAKATKLTTTEYGNVIGDIPSGLTKELKTISPTRPIHSLLVEEDVYIGVYDDRCTKFSISGNKAMQFALDNFVVDYTKYKEHLEKRIQFMITERDRFVKNQNERIERMNKTLLLFANYDEA